MFLSELPKETDTTRVLENVINPLKLTSAVVNSYQSAAVKPLYPAHLASVVMSLKKWTTICVNTSYPAMFITNGKPGFFCNTLPEISTPFAEWLNKNTLKRVSFVKVQEHFFAYIQRNVKFLVLQCTVS